MIKPTAKKIGESNGLERDLILTKTFIQLPIKYKNSSYLRMLCLQYSAEISSHMSELTFKMKNTSINTPLTKLNENSQIGKI